MMNILRETVLFFRRERLYFLLILFAGACYAAVIFTPHVKGKPEAALSEENRLFKEVEKKFGQKTLTEKAYNNFAKQKPLLAAVYQGMTVFFFLAIFAGIVIDVLFLLVPAWRQNFMSGAPPPQTRPWPFSILFKTILLFVVWAILLSVAFGVINTVFGRPISDNFFMILHTFLINTLCLVFIIRFLKQQGSDWRELGFRVPDGKVLREIWIGFVAYLRMLPIFFLILVVLFMIAGLMAYEPPPHPLVNVFLAEEKRQPLLVVFSVLLGTVIGPIFEEIFFRGFCYPVLKGRIGKFWGMVGSAAFFSGIHYSGFAFWPIFALGIWLAYVYESRKTLLSPIVIHIIHNTIFIAYFFILKEVGA